jgi:hypothetical protein
MSHVNETKVNSSNGTVEVGAGPAWDQVYATLEPTGVSGIPSVGVAGSTLGDGKRLPSSECSILYAIRLFI